MKKYPLIIVIALALCLSACSNNKPQTDIEDLTSRQLLEWHNDKFGMFIHFGLYSIPAGVWNGEKVPYYSEQIMNHARIPAEEYEQLAKQFNPTDWNADEVVRLAKNAGMKYIVFTSKHHDGFCMFKTKTTDYNVVDATPYGKDIVAQLAESCKKYGIKLGLYYSLPDWHFSQGLPRLAKDTSTDCTEYVNQMYSPIEGITPQLEECIVGQLTELLTNYGEIETIWFDMGLPTPQQSERLRNLVKSLQPECLVSGRIMNNYGDYLTLPDNGLVAGYSDVMWDNPASMYGTWGYRSWQERPDADVQIQRQLKRLMSTVSHGGVFLLNIGPTGTGQVLDYEKQVLKGIGDWVAINHDAIYSTLSSPFEHLQGALCTRLENRLFFTIVDSLDVLECNELKSSPERVYLLENGNSLDFVQDDGLKISLTQENIGKLYVVVAEFASSPVIEPLYISPNADGNITLSGKDGIMHATFDARTYITNQPDSWISWHINLPDEADYDVFAVYTPEFYDKEYVFECGDQTVTHVLPGVDDMMQTCYVGLMKLASGKNDFSVRLSHYENPLDPLGIEVHKIILRKK